MKPSTYLFKLSLTPLALLTSCATMVNGSNQSIGITTDPTNAEVWLDNRLVGRSPIILEMKRSDNHFVRVQLEGYQPHDLTFTREVSGWVAGNIVFGGFIGIAVDAITGGIYKLTPDQVQVEMRKEEICDSKEEVSCSRKSGDSFITIVLKADPSWEKVGQLIACNQL